MYNDLNISNCIFKETNARYSFIYCLFSIELYGEPISPILFVDNNFFLTKSKNAYVFGGNYIYHNKEFKYTFISRNNCIVPYNDQFFINDSLIITEDGNNNISMDALFKSECIVPTSTSSLSNEPTMSNEPTTQFEKTDSIEPTIQYETTNINEQTKQFDFSTSNQQTKQFDFTNINEQTKQFDFTTLNALIMSSEFTASHHFKNLEDETKNPTKKKKNNLKLIFVIIFFVIECIMIILIIAIISVVSKRKKQHFDQLIDISD